MLWQMPIGVWFVAEKDGAVDLLQQCLWQLDNGWVRFRLPNSSEATTAVMLGDAGLPAATGLLYPIQCLSPPRCGVRVGHHCMSSTTPVRMVRRDGLAPGSHESTVRNASCTPAAVTDSVDAPKRGVTSV